MENWNNLIVDNPIAQTFQRKLQYERPSIKVSGLGFIRATHSPHYDVEKDRRPGLEKVMQKTPGVAIAIDNCCAVEFVDDTYRVISSKIGAKAYKTFWKGGKYFEVELEQRKDFLPMTDLLMK